MIELILLALAPVFFAWGYATAIMAARMARA